MRQKAEKKIRAAAATLGVSSRYRIDQVRERTDLIRKVFDKTILDMARLKAIELHEGSADNLNPAETGNLLYYLNRRYVYFSFLDQRIEQTTSEPQKSNPPISGIESEMWQKFEYLCEKKEGKDSTRKLCELISNYIKASEL